MAKGYKISLLEFSNIPGSHRDLFIMSNTISNGLPKTYRHEGTIEVPDPNRPIDSLKEYVYLLVGPVGAGKSRFIEMLAGSDDLQISKDQLESCTQLLVPYEFVHISAGGVKVPPYGHRVNIIDTPGFSDSQMSELEIVTMVNQWLKDHKCTRVHTILYFCPITDVRLSGSRRRTIQMLKLMIGVGTATPGSVFIVTTMWNRLSGDKGRDSGEKHFSQLKTDIWSDVQDPDNALYKFWDTHASALDILHTTMDLKNVQVERRLNSLSTNLDYDAYDPEHSGPPEKAPFAPSLYLDLLNRIRCTQQEKEMLESDLAGLLDVEENQELTGLLQQQFRKSTQLLEKFERQLMEFGGPPAGCQVDEGTSDLIKLIFRKHGALPPPSIATAIASTGLTFSTGPLGTRSSRFGHVFKGITTLKSKLGRKK